MAQAVKTVEVKAPAEEKLRKIKIGGVEHLVREESVEIEKLIAEGCRLTQQLEEVQAKLKAVKERALAVAAERNLLVEKKSAKIAGVAGICEITLKQDLKVIDAPALQDLFGANFERYVASEVVFKAQKPLRELIADGDHEHRDKVRAAVQIKESEYVRFIPRER